MLMCTVSALTLSLILLAARLAVEHCRQKVLPSLRVNMGFALTPWKTMSTSE